MTSNDTKILPSLQVKINYVFILGGLLLAFWSLFSFMRASQLMMTPNYGGVDFHAYWYAGLYLRQGQDPYTAFFSEMNVDSPINFIDKSNPQMYTTPAGLSIVPANTAPIVLLLTPFAWFSWPTAKTIWLIINIVLALLLPWLTFRSLPEAENLTWTDKLLTSLIFYAMTSTRRALDTGQTTLLIVSLMVGALLLARKNWAVAGILLGIAMSKYSVTLPLFLFFLYQRQFRLIVTSLVVQLAALLSIAVMTSTSPLLIVDSYLRLFLQHLNGKGIHMGQFLPSGSPWRLIVPIMGTLLLLGWVVQVLRRKQGKTSNFIKKSDDSFYAWHILTILSLWALLVAYHRLYDVALILFFLVLMATGLRWSTAWQLSSRAKYLLSFLTMGIFFAFILPGDTVAAMLAPQTAVVWADALLYIQTGALLCSLCLSIYLWLYHMTGKVVE
jgi:hypothetical protein